MQSSSISGPRKARLRRFRLRNSYFKPFPDGFLDLEDRLACCGLRLVAGVDEAGRGPLAGPVVASAVILDQQNVPAGIDDSKRLSPAARERIFEAISLSAVAVGVGVVPPEVIDRGNIIQATLQAMAEAVGALSARPECVVVDGRNLPDLPMPAIAVVQGDARCVSVAAASVVAKVTRDRIMEDMDLIYPQYSFGRNKGYGTRAHLEALRKYGPSSIHRLSFEPVSVLVGGALDR